MEAAKNVIDFEQENLYCSRSCALDHGSSKFNLEIATPDRLRVLAKQMTGESLERTFGSYCVCGRDYAFFPETGI